MNNGEGKMTNDEDVLPIGTQVMVGECPSRLGKVAAYINDFGTLRYRVQFDGDVEVSPYPFLRCRLTPIAGPKPLWEPGKEYLTRDGRRARVYTTDGGGDWPIHGPIHGAILLNGGWCMAYWSEAGASPNSASWDLMPPKPPVVVSDAVFGAYIDACGGTRKALAAAIAQYLSEQAE